MEIRIIYDDCNIIFNHPGNVKEWKKIDKIKKYLAEEGFEFNDKKIIHREEDEKIIETGILEIPISY